MSYKDFAAAAITKIEKDVRDKGESIVSDITFFGAIFFLDVRDRNNKVTAVKYSAAERIMSGYRKLVVG
jgi:hypothetical protein